MLVIFDKDGTLMRPKSGGQFVTVPDDQELLPGVKERIAELVKAGATIAIASNQGGVAAGYKFKNIKQSQGSKTAMTITFTPSHPCRCGYSGQGRHLCHAGRSNGFRCQNEAVPFLRTQLTSLAGVQVKLGAMTVCYCEGCKKEAGF